MRVLMTLVVNARDAMPNGGTMKIRATPEIQAHIGTETTKDPGGPEPSRRDTSVRSRRERVALTLCSATPMLRAVWKRAFLIGFGACVAGTACVGQGVDLVGPAPEANVGGAAALTPDGSSGGVGASQGAVGGGAGLGANAGNGTDSGGMGSAAGVAGRGAGGSGDTDGQGGDGWQDSGGEAGGPWDGPCDRGTVEGDVVATNDADIRALSGVVEITGSLSFGADVSDLSHLTCLKRVGDSLLVGRNENLLTLDGLSALESIGGTLRASIASRIEEISLPELRSVATLVLDRPGQLETLSLPMLSSVEGRLSIQGGKLADLTGLSRLERVGNLELSSERIESLAGLENLVEAHGIQLISVTRLTSLSPLARLASLTTLTVRDTRIQTLRGLEGVESLLQLDLHANAWLTSVDGLEGLKRAGSILILNCRQLESLGGLRNLRSLDVEESGSFVETGMIALSGLDALENLQGLESLTSINQMWLSNNAALTTLEGLGAEVTSLHLSQLPSLQNLEALAGLTSFESLELSKVGLPNLRGLESLRTIRSFTLHDNPNLASLRALEGLEGIEDADVRYNTSLPTCEVDWLLANTVVGSSLIEQNDDAGVCTP
jgi:hypothetical protein